MSNIGTTVRGIRLPIVKENDNLTEIIIDALRKTITEDGIQFKDNDVVAITESLIARAYGNYVDCDDIAKFVRDKFGENATVGVLWPIYSRNRFSLILKGIARGAKRVVVQLKHGKDEVGNDIYNEWTGVNIIDYYRELIENEGAEAVIMQSASACDIVPAADGNVIIASIHSRFDHAKDIANYIIWNTDRFKHSNVITLDQIFNQLSTEHGYNADWGLLGSNKCGDDKLKLFPTKISCQTVCDAIKEWVKEITDKDVHVMVYGDGCFKDPVAGIWEFADPISCPYHTPGILDRSPNEIKIKYIADAMTDNEQNIKNLIKDKHKEIKNNSMLAQGTTPRRYFDLLASLCDLTSGSGDKGTPVIWIQDYFKNFSDF